MNETTVSVFHAKSNKTKKPGSLEFYRTQIFTALQVIKLLEARLRLLQASIGEQQSRHLPNNDSVKSYLYLMESSRTYRKRLLKCQLLELAVNTAIQSTLLHTTPVSLNNNSHEFMTTLVNYLDSVTDRAKDVKHLEEALNGLYKSTMQTKGNIMCQQAVIKRILDQNVQNNNKKKDNNELSKKTELKLRKINTMATFIHTFVSSTVSLSPLISIDDQKELLSYSIKWHETRTPNYYIKLYTKKP